MDDNIPDNMDQAWSTLQIITKLVEAADILLHKKDYDGHGWEEIEIAFQEGKKIIENHINK